MPKTAAKHTKPKTRRYTIDNPPTGFTMSVADLADLIEEGRNQAYAAVKAGVYPSVRIRKKIQVLTVPTLAILRGERPPGTNFPKGRAAA